MAPTRTTTGVRTEEQPNWLLVAGDHPLTRAGIIATVGDEPGLRICGEAASSEEVFASLDANRADLLILDVSMRNGMGIKLVRQIKDQINSLRILALSNHEEWLYASRMLQAGAMAYLHKSAPPQMIIQAVRHLVAGQAYFGPELMTRMLGYADQRSAENDSISRLTQRQFQVFELIGEGKTSQYIARILQLSVHTVETYRERLKSKLNANNGADLTFQAIVWRRLHE